MTETTTRIEQAGAHGPELSGVDLARVALHAAREAARKRGDSEVTWAARPCAAALRGRSRGAPPRGRTSVRHGRRTVTRARAPGGDRRGRRARR